MTPTELIDTLPDWLRVALLDPDSSYDFEQVVVTHDAARRRTRVELTFEGTLLLNPPPMMMMKRSPDGTYIR